MSTAHKGCLAGTCPKHCGAFGCDTATPGAGLWYRKRITVNTDPQRRCYDGCNFSEAEVWTAWSFFMPCRSRERAEEEAQSWRQLCPKNEYEVRGAP